MNYGFPKNQISYHYKIQSTLMECNTKPDKHFQIWHPKFAHFNTKNIINKHPNTNKIS